MTVLGYCEKRFFNEQIQKISQHKDQTILKIKTLAITVIHFRTLKQSLGELNKTETSIANLANSYSYSST